MDSADQIVQSLLANLENIVASLIIDTPQNLGLRQNPDDPVEHEPNWHQFGIITHSRNFVSACRAEVWSYLEQWGLAEAMRVYLSTSVDGKSKYELLQIAAALHDLGKFERGSVTDEGIVRPDYERHEERSEWLIRNDQRVRDTLIQLGLNEEQRDYIAANAGLHYELGKMRTRAKASGAGYSFAYTASDEFRVACADIAGGHKNYAVEIGLLFLCDTLGKTNIRLAATSDEEVLGQTEYVELMLQDRGLNPALRAQVLQTPVNIAVAHAYLDFALSMGMR